ncbi:MAG: ATPase [Actinomycetota bacterium]|nr:ATPase [Actinomycetota bacterium]
MSTAHSTDHAPSDIPATLQETTVDTIVVESFGYLHAPPPPAATVVVDLRRRMRDPHTDPALRALTGRDTPIIDKVWNAPHFAEISQAIRALTLAMVVPGEPLHLAIGCAGGRHRSVVMADHTAALMNAMLPDIAVFVRHRDIARPVVQR